MGQLLRISLAVLQKVKLRVSTRPGTSTPGCPPKRNDNIHPHKNLPAPVRGHTIHNRQKVETTQCPSTDKWRHKTRSIHITERHSARKKSEVPTQTTTWTDPVREVKGKGILRGREHMQRSCGNKMGCLCGTAKKGFGVAGGEGTPGGAENGGRGQSPGAEP